MRTLLFGLLLCAGLLTAAVCDARCRTIPYSACALIAAAGLISFSPAHFYALILALPFWAASRGNRGGMGDVFLIAASSFALGLSRGAIGLAFGLFCFCLYYPAAAAVRRHRGEKIPASLPLAPFLAAGYLAAYFMI